MSRTPHREALNSGSPLPLLSRWFAIKKRQRAAAVQDAGALVLLLPFVTILLLAGCATAPRSQIQRPPDSSPTDALVTQRGVLTVLGRQFTLNGYLATSASGGQRLIVTENFGSVLADVLVKHDGTVVVMRSSRAFKAEWIRQFVAADLLCIFGDAPRADCPGRQLSPTHFVIERRRYKLELHIVETRFGTQPAELFDETQRATP